jgi:IgA Peptidase M64/Secretion system C-terminal sorting domain
MKTMKMKKITLLFAIATLFSTAKAQIFPVDTIQNNGLPTKLVKFIFLSDGFTSAQLPDFIARVNSFKDNLFGQPPFSNYRSFFNVYAIKVPSVETGIDHPGTATDIVENAAAHPVLSVNTYFNTTFDYANIHRLVFPQNAQAIFDVMLNNFPNYNQIFMFANSAFYGGSGGTYATATVNNNSDEVAIHEIGHSFAFLADEYMIGGQGERPNRTAMNAVLDSTTVKWKNWIGSNGIGIYPIGIEGWQRPHQNCKMQFLNVPFCAVCKEALVEKIYSIVTPIYSFLPALDSVKMDVATQFSVKLTLPIPNTLKSEWKLNGVAFAGNIDSVKLLTTSLINGDNKLTVFVTDSTMLSRKFLPKSGYIFSKTWVINKKTTAIKTTEKSDKFYYQISPNPANEALNIKGNTDYRTDIKVELYNEMGGKVYDSTLKNVQNDFQQTIPIALVPNGAYIVILSLPNGFSVKETILKVD